MWATGLVAAAARMQAPRPGSVGKARRQVAAQWQADAWDAAEDIPEAGNVVRYAGSQIGLVTATVTVAGTAGERVSVTDDASPIPDRWAQLLVSGLATTVGGDITSPGPVWSTVAQNLVVAGDCYLVEPVADPNADTPERDRSWQVASVSQIGTTSDGGWAMKDSPSDQPRPVAWDRLIRVWVRHPRWSSAAWSPFLQLEDDFEALRLLSGEGRAGSASRASAGILLVPNELTFSRVGVDAPGPVSPDADAQSFIDALAQVMAEPIEDPSAPSSVVPFLVRGPAEHLAAVRHIELGRPRDAASWAAEMQARVERVARGVDLPVEIVMGHQSTTFANGAVVDKTRWRDHMGPLAALIASSWTIGPARAEWERLGVPPEIIDMVHVGFDPSAALATPDPIEHAQALHAAMVISDHAYRTVTGFGDGDAPDADELARRVASAPKTVTASAAPTSAPTDGAASAAAVSPDGLDVLAVGLAQIDRDLRRQLQVAAGAAMERALDRAGSRIRYALPRALRDTVDGTDNRRVIATLGADRVAATLEAKPGVLDDPEAWTELADKYEAWTLAAWAAALGLLAGLVPAARLAAVETQIAGWVAAGWVALRGDLEAGRRAMMWADQTTSAPGEADATVVVSAGVVRTAVHVAGGGTVTPGEPAAGGVAAGVAVLGALTDAEIMQSGWVWWYGSAATRTAAFEPHQRLEGTRFVSWTDPALDTGGSWVGSHFFPGDHHGCQCDAIPTFLAPGG